MFTKVATTLALKTLKDKDLIDKTVMYDGSDEYIAYGLTEKGWIWTIENQDQFVLRRSKFGKNKSTAELLNEDIPF